MTAENGSSKSPASTVARSMAELGHDAVTLAELQAELLKSEVRDWLSGVVTPAVLLISALVLALGSIPVLLLSLAYLLVEMAQLSQALSLLISTLIGLVIAAAAAAIGWWRFKKNSVKLQRSQDELRHNVRWIKQVLKHKANPPGACRSATKSSRRRYAEVR